MFEDKILDLSSEQYFAWLKEYYEGQPKYTYNEAYEASLDYFKGDDLASKVFIDKYALQHPDGSYLESTPDAMFCRLATEFYRIERKKFKDPMSYEEIYGLLKDFKYLVPQGGPLYGIGNPFSFVTLSNCYFIDTSDSYAGIMKTDEELVQISKHRGGVGIDISPLRPRNSPTKNAAKTSTGAVSFAERFSHSIREVGQCLHKDTLVLCTNGLVPIKDIEIGNEVWTNDGWVEVLNKIKNTKACVKITTKLGKEIICSPEHTFHTIEGEKQASDFKVGDEITHILGNEWYGKEIELNGVDKGQFHKNTKLHDLPIKLESDLAYLLGYSYGDGYIQTRKNSPNNKRLIIALDDNWTDIISQCQNICEYYNFPYKTYNGFGKSKRIMILQTLGIKWLEENNLLKQKSSDIKFPTQLLEANSNILFAFIAGYWDADGSVTNKKYIVTSINKLFLLTIQNILSSYGIISTLRKQKRDEPRQKIYHLSINSKRSQQKFVNLVDPFSIKAQKHGAFIKNRDHNKSTLQLKEIPQPQSPKIKYLTNNDQYITHSTMEKLCNDLGLEDHHYLYQDHIKSVEIYDDNKKQEVYDLCLEREHYFFANGLYAHNSGRRGALMLTMSVHHPDVLEFIEAKANLDKITGANISLRLSDEFLNAVEKDELYELRFPVDSSNVIDKIPAKEVWDKIIFNNWRSAEPGILQWDRIINESPADCYSDVGFSTKGTNPCSEIPLSKNDSCRLMLQNLFSYVINPFTTEAYFDYDLCSQHASLLIRLMDDMIDLEVEMLDRIIDKIKNDSESDEIKYRELNLWLNIKEVCLKGRRLGSGLTATGDTLAALGIAYDSSEGLETAVQICRERKLASYRSSVDMAKELGPFPVYDSEKEKNNPFILRIKEEDPRLYEDMVKYGRRNIALLTIAPTGSVSILTQTSGGIEPEFSVVPYMRRKKGNPGDANFRSDFVDQSGDYWMEFEVVKPKLKLWMEIAGETDYKKSPWWGSCANDINWENKVKLVGFCNKHIDHSISQTINVPKETTVEEIDKIYVAAWKYGCKGASIYRDGCRTGVLVHKTTPAPSPTTITKTNAPKRPKVLPADVYHTTYQGTPYFVIVGLLDGEPYEVFAGHNGFIDKKVKSAQVEKVRRGHYRAKLDNDEVVENIAEHITDEEAAICRLISLSLRHGTDIAHCVLTLQKVPGDMNSFGKVLARIIKKYVSDGTKISGFGDDNEVYMFKEGCVTRQSDGWTQCN